MGASTLQGFLCVNTVEITAAEILAGQLIQLAAPGGPNQAALLRTLILSLEYGGTPYVQPLNAGLVCFYQSPSRLAAWGSGGGQGPGFAITAVANASGGDTVYSGTIVGGGSGAYVGLYDEAVGDFAHSANGGRFLCTASTATSITLANPSGVAETPTGAAVLIELPGGVWGCGLGGSSDVSSILLATESEVLAYGNTSWNFPASDIVGSSIVLGNPLPVNGSPTPFTEGNSSLLVTVEYLSAPL
jgi:hypothetical protein